MEEIEVGEYIRTDVCITRQIEDKVFVEGTFILGTRL